MMVIDPDLAQAVAPGPGVSYPVALALTNPGAETGSASGWTAAAGGSLWSSDNRITTGFPNPVYEGSRYFWAGANANARMYQDVDVSAYASDIDAGLVVGEITARFTTSTNYGDYLSMFIRALDASDTVISSVSQQELTCKDLLSGWRSQDLNMLLPSGTRKIRIEFHATRQEGADNDVFLDAINLTLYENDRRITPTYGVRVGRGHRTSLITVTSTNLVGFGSLSGLVDGNQNNDYYFNSAASNGTQWLTFDFGPDNAYIIDEFIWKQQNTTEHGVWRLEGSPDNTNWTQIGSDFTLTGGIIQPGGANSTAYRYYRLRAMSGSRSSGPYLYEILFRGTRDPSLDEPLVSTWYNKAGGNLTSLTYTTMAIGSPHPDRWVIVGVYTNFNAGRSLSAVTIGGVSATLMYASHTLTAPGARLEFWKANVPTGTVVSVVATSADTMYDGTCGAWVCYKEPIFSAGVIDLTVSGTSFSLNIDVPEGGAVIAFSNNAGGGYTVTSFTGVTQEFVDTVYRMAAGSEDMLSAETGRPIDITWNSASPYPDFDGLGAMSVYF